MSNLSYIKIKMKGLSLGYGIHFKDYSRWIEVLNNSSTGDLNVFKQNFYRKSFV